MALNRQRMASMPANVILNYFNFIVDKKRRLCYTATHARILLLTNYNIYDIYGNAWQVCPHFYIDKLR